MQMNKYLYLICILFFGLCNAQMKIEIQKPSVIGKRDLSVVKIIDDRQNKENIGIVPSGNAGYKKTANLKSDLSNELLSFYKLVYPNKNANNQLVIHVLKFEIDHQMFSHGKDSASALIEFKLFRFFGDSLKYIGNTKARVVDAGSDLYYSHANRLKRALLVALETNDFSFSELQSSSNLNNNDSIAKLNIQKQNINQNQKSNSEKKSMVVVGAHISASTQNILYGGHFQILFRLPNYRKMFFGPHINYSVIQFKDELPPGVKSYFLRSSDFGLRILSQIDKGTYFSVTAHGMLGKETIEESKNGLNYNVATNTMVNGNYFQTTTNNLSCFQLDVGVTIMRPDKVGPFIGLELFGRFTNSNYFVSTFGIKPSLGLKF